MGIAHFHILLLHGCASSLEHVCVEDAKRRQYRIYLLHSQLFIQLRLHKTLVRRVQERQRRDDFIDSASLIVSYDCLANLHVLLVDDQSPISLLFWVFDLFPRVIFFHLAFGES